MTGGREGSEGIIASVIVPAGPCEKEPLTDCLAALRRQDFAEAFEVVVAADEGCRFDLGGAAPPSMRLVHCRPGAGPGGARNSAVREARGKYLAFTDADCIPAADWLRLLVERCRSSGGRPVGGYVEAGYPDSFATRAAMISETGIGRPVVPVPVGALSGANMCMSAGWWALPGVEFAERVYGSEETAMLESLPPESRPWIMDPAPTVRHMERYSPAETLRRQYRLGLGSGRLRRAMPMRGSMVARLPLLAPLLVPARLLFTLRRLSRCDRKSRVDFLLFFPLILFQWAAYAAGFAVGAMKGAGAPSPTS